MIIVIKKKHKDSGSVLKALANKDSQLKTFKKQASQGTDKLKAKQKKLETDLGKSENANERLAHVTEWLPKLEASVLTQAPVSADYRILHRQQIEQSVRADNFRPPQFLFLYIYIGE